MPAEWAAPFLAATWGTLLSRLAPQFPPDERADSSDEWFAFAGKCLIAPATTALIGICVATALFVRSCLRGGVDPRRPPSSKPVICTSVLGLLCTAAGVFAYVTVCRVDKNGIVPVVQEVHNIFKDASDAREQFANLTRTGTLLSEAFTEVKSTFPAEVPGEFGEFQSILDEVLEKARSAGSYMAALPKQVSDFAGSNKLAGVAKIVWLSLSVPLVLVMLCCIIIFVMVWATRSLAGRGRCSCRCIHVLGAAVFAPAVLLIAALAACELGGAMAMASFCVDPTENALSIIHKLGNQHSYGISRYYLRGDGNNPLIGVVESIEACEADLKNGRGVSRFLPEGDWSQLTPLVADLRAPLDQLQRLLDPVHVYKRYEDVHKIACPTMVNGLGWLIVSQLAVGLLCLPVLGCMADTFFDRRVAWQSKLQMQMPREYGTMT
uniref:Uncharacterized protein n=1 Tax=Zooxanthella nutricula TaxID=1333877 RepID=A0A7S2NM59_9DINO